MKFIYATSISYPSGLANRMQILAMSKALGEKMGNNFWLGGQNIKMDGANFQILNFKTAKSYLLAPKYLKFAKKNNADIVYCREPKLLLFLCIFGKISGTKVKFAYEVHRIIDDNFLNQIAEKILSSFVDKYIFVTKHLADMYLEKYGLDKKQIFVAPDGVDLKIFDIGASKEEARTKLDLPQNMKIIGYCGRYKTMGEDKGFFDILEALKLLPQNVIFVAMGGKPRHVAEYQKVADDMGLSGRAFFRGHYTQDIVALYQKAFDVLLMPFPANLPTGRQATHYSYYMSPMKMFEYMASKRPIIASDLPSTREVLNESNSVLVEAGNPKALADGIKKVLDNPALAQKISAQAYEDSKKYEWGVRAENIIKFLR
ncbi:MAG: glycosyltransferase family 4 protein [bacterium]|nr:glycosyltransferase family 4 protein [bacterium]